MSERKLSWFEHITLNAYWLGLNIASGTITPLLLPYLVLLFMPAEEKNTYLANVRVIGLTVAMLVQPLGGMLSDRSTSRFGRRRPFIFGGAIVNAIFLVLVGATPLFIGSPLDAIFQSALGISTAYAVLLLGIVLLQFSSNLSQGALQGLIPDLVPENQRGRSSGVKAVLELLPVFLVIFIGPLIDGGRIALVVSIVAAGYLLTMAVTVFFTRETPLYEKLTEGIGDRFFRLLALTGIFVGATRLAVWLVSISGNALARMEVSREGQILLVGLAGLAAMAGSILIGVYFGASVGIGKNARQQTSFIWWVINRLLFLAAVGSIQGFAQYYLRDVLQLPNPVTSTTILLAAVALFLIPSAIYGGTLADRFGPKRLVATAGLIAAFGTLVLLFAQSFPVVILSGCIIGLGTGTFMASNWALGTELAPPLEAGRYLGISNLAGAGAGIVGAGIGGPMADFFNRLEPGLGYLVIFAIYGALFLISALALTRVHFRPAATQG
ncbi:MAG: MFS transporter [Chloroflexota bacterium]|jgi:MFS family permease